MRWLWLWIPLLLLNFAPSGAEEYTGPTRVNVPNIRVQVELPEGWSLRYQHGPRVQTFFINALRGSVRSLRFFETTSEAGPIEVALAEYRRVQGHYAQRSDVTYTIDERGDLKPWYYIHFTVSHPQLGDSKGLVACTKRGPGKFLVATGEGTLARTGKRKGLKPTNAEMFEMRDLLKGVKP